MFAAFNDLEIEKLKAKRAASLETLRLGTITVTLTREAKDTAVRSGAPMRSSRKRPIKSHRLSRNGRSRMTVDFTGSWIKDIQRSQNYDEFSTALGTPFLVVKAVSGLPARKIIDHCGSHWKQESHVSIHHSTVEFILDGSVKKEKHPFRRNAEVSTQHHMSDAGRYQRPVGTITCESSTKLLKGT